VTNRRKMLNRFHGLSLGFSAIVCALACGSGDQKKDSSADAPGRGETLDPPRNVEGTPPAGDQLSPACDDTPLSTACADNPGPGGAAPNS
jgi:hypothetical protein